MEYRFLRRAAILSGSLFVGLNAWAGPLDGTWRVTEVTCNGQAANADISQVYSEPNQLLFTFDDATGALSAVTPGCLLSLPLAFEYEGADAFRVRNTGPINCVPAGCDATCGEVEEDDGPFNFNYVLAENRLTISAVSEADDDACTEFGQEGPVRYTLSKQ